MPGPESETARGNPAVKRRPDERGIIESRVFPGLRLNVDRLMAEDLAGVLAAQNAGR